MKCVDVYSKFFFSLARGTPLTARPREIYGRGHQSACERRRSCFSDIRYVFIGVYYVD